MGTSTTTPPSGTTADPVPSLYLSDTFYTWFNTTNDVINKVNPIEVYTLAAATGGYNSNSIAAAYGSTTGIGGVTIDDLGNGNFKLGYVIPEKLRVVIHFMVILTSRRVHLVTSQTVSAVGRVKSLVLTP